MDGLAVVGKELNVQSLISFSAATRYARGLRPPLTSMRIVDYDLFLYRVMITWTETIRVLALDVENEAKIRARSMLVNFRRKPRVDVSVAVDFTLKFLTSSLTCCAAGIQFVLSRDLNRKYYERPVYYCLVFML